MQYTPTFAQSPKGKYTDYANFASLNVGTDAYVTEREMNELQWIRIENEAKIVRELTKSGVLTVSDKSNLSKNIEVINNDIKHLNSFSLPSFKTIVNGFLNIHQSYIKNDSNENIDIKLPNPPVGNIRNDFVYLEFWFTELKETDKVPKYGYIKNDSLDYNIIDERIEAETSRRIQIQWTWNVYEDYEGKCVNGFLDVDGKPNVNIHPLGQTGYTVKDYNFEQSKDDKYLFIAGEGIVQNTKIHTVDGYSYAIPMFNIQRINNSGYDALNNPNGGIDYVSDILTPNSDRPDGKFSNVIYNDQISDIRHLAALSEEQYNKIYVTLNEYYTDNTIMKNKLLRVSNDIDNLNSIIKKLGYILPCIHDKDIYGIESFRQQGQTAGAIVDTLGGNKMLYKHRKYIVGNQLKNKSYCIVSSLIDYEYDEIGEIGDLYVDKNVSKFNIYNTGAANLHLDLSALLIDSVTVYSGEDVFNGEDGTFITMPFTLDKNRYFVYVCAEENSNGRNGEIYVKLVENQVIVYNTGITTTKSGVVQQTTGNKFQYVVIDMYSDALKNISTFNVILNGNNGVTNINKAYGEDFGIMIGTPIFDTATTIVAGSIGDVYADVETDNQCIIYNTGSTGAIVQCIVFNEVNYNEYYDTLNVPMKVTVPNIV